ncbi:hypothetical protein OAA06_00260 [bacterium]|nr:hypothetical protein [bacterium]
MNPSRPTIGIYAIQDRVDSDTPCYVHDHGITIMDQGRVLKQLTLERISRKKHDHTLHKSLFDVIKGEGLISPDDFDLVFTDNVVGRTTLSSCGKIRFEAPLVHRLKAEPELGKCWWVDHERSAYIVNHELAHVSANLPFYGEFKENSLLVHFDGGGSLSNFSVWLYRQGKMQSVDFHWKFKYLSSFFNANALVFGIIGAKFVHQNSVPGKMMGLAAFGSYSAKMENWLKAHNYWADIWAKKGSFYAAAKKTFGWKKNQLQINDPFLQDIIATLHHVFIRDFMAELKALQSIHHCDYLYYSGGSALNIVANTHIVSSGLFKDVFIPPCPDDSGLSLGAAAYVELLKHGKVESHSAYLNNWGLNQKNTSYTPEDIKQCADSLLAKKVVGICNGVGEIGPRALGNRSIVALANSKVLADKVSQEHKGREWYRPVAPIMLEKNARYFTGLDQLNHLGKYMLLDFPIIPDKQKEIEGVVHVDGTARIQVVTTRDENPFMFDLLTYLDQDKGIRALINTSFNKRGEPIVHNQEDALNSARNMKLDGVVIDGQLTILNGSEDR